MPLELVEVVVFGRLFKFLPPMRVSQFSEQIAIDDRPKPMPSLLNYPAWSSEASCLKLVRQHKPDPIFELTHQTDQYWSLFVEGIVKNQIFP